MSNDPNEARGSMEQRLTEIITHILKKNMQSTGNHQMAWVVCHNDESVREGYIRNGGKEAKLFTRDLKAFQCNNRIVMAQRKHLDDFLRGRIFGRLECGRTQLEVSEELGIAQSVISRLWQRFQDDGNKADEVVFYGVNSKSECLLVRIARGCNQVADAWIFLRLANGKTYNLSETFGYQQSSDDKCETFSCGKLQMHYLIPMRRWRIFFCGMLKETSETNDVCEEVFVKFVFLWKASSDVYDLTLHTNPEGFASAMARAGWKVPFVPPVKK
ncbi:UNVERIFIED_CONTAM: hypothetical protein NCL1_51719 [Trichonephila clavipes]